LPNGLSIDPNQGIISGTVVLSAASNSTTITVTDTASNESANVTINWTVQDPAPVVVSPGDQTNLVGDTVNLPVTATDVDGAALVYSATGLPNGLSIDPNQGIISGTVAASSASNSATITATDTASNESASVTINWTVQAPAPVVVSPGDQTNLVGDTVYLPISASVSDGAPLVYSATVCPAG